MTFEERVRLIKRLDDLLKRKFKGNSCEYAFKLGISRSAFFRLLDYVKTEFNSPVCYNKDNGGYEYCKSGSMYIGFLPNEVLNEDALKKIQEGGHFLHESK